MTTELNDDRIVRFLEQRFDGLDNRMDEFGRRIDSLTVQVTKTNGRVTDAEKEAIRYEAKLAEVETQARVLRSKVKQMTGDGDAAPLLTRRTWQTVLLWVAGFYGAAQLMLQVWSATRQ